MPYQNPDPGYIPRLQQILEALQAEIAEREEATAALAARTPNCMASCDGGWPRARASTGFW